MTTTSNLTAQTETVAAGRILIVNPNSTVQMTNALKPIVAPLLPPDITATYFTGPPSSPPSINDKETSRKSAEECLPHLRPMLPNYDAVLIACYSEHPLVPMLREITSVPVAGIMEASLYHSLALLSPSGKFGIVTTGKAWESLLTDGVDHYLGGKGRFASVQSTGLDADQLHDAPPEELKRRMTEAVERLLENKQVEAVCLGCAGMVGLRSLVLEAAHRVGREVKVVDGVEAGVGVLAGMLGRGYEKAT